MKILIALILCTKGNGGFKILRRDRIVNLGGIAFHSQFCIE